MAEQPEPTPRPRTVSRLRFVAPPGMEVDAGEGRKTIGRYEIIKTLGRGAMGVVYKARDPLLDRIVAIKTIVSPQGVGRRVRAAYLERFQREAKAAAKMSHPAIVTIFDVGVDDEWGAPFMVLEYLPGESLADRLDRVRMPLGKAVQIALDLASALAFAHRQRIVHRDVKPANVLHAGENRWKLADFGIARLPDSDLTQVGIFMGTPGYSPPEAIREGRYTPQADVFAWGAVLYELLSGRIPYEGPDTRTTNGYVVKGDAPSPAHYDASIPAPLAQVCMTALEPTSGTRLRDGADAEVALRETWEKCLTGGLVSPAALASEELPHEKVGPTMHGHVTRQQPAVATSGQVGGSSGMAKAEPPPRPRQQSPAAGSLTDRDEPDEGLTTERRDPAEMAAVSRNAGSSAGRRPEPPPPQRGRAEPMLVIESRGRERAGDDDPTRILVRDDDPRRDDSRTRPMRPDDSKPRRGDGSGAQRQGTDDVDDRPGVPTWLVLLLIVGALATLVGGWLLWQRGF